MVVVANWGDIVFFYETLLCFPTTNDLLSKFFSWRPFGISWASTEMILGENIPLNNVNVGSR